MCNSDCDGMSVMVLSPGVASGEAAGFKPSRRYSHHQPDKTEDVKVKGSLVQEFWTGYLHVGKEINIVPVPL